MQREACGLIPPPPLDDLKKIPNAVRKAKRIFFKSARGGGGGPEKLQIFGEYICAVRLGIMEGGVKIRWFVVLFSKKISPGKRIV